MLLRILRVFLFIPAPVIDRERALVIAGQRCEQLGWKVEGPLVTEGLKSWKVLRGSPWFVVCNQSGDIIRHGHPPR